MRFLDPSRSIRFPGARRRQPRPLLTYVRYPATGSPTRSAVLDAAPASAGGPFPLVVFAHGFAVTPRTYTRLLDSWVRAGYVVAAPVFPMENADAPGGPNGSDLVNEPQDLRVVISRMLAASAAPAGPLAGLLDPTEVAVAGQSDGGEAALAAAYSRGFRDARIDAAMILSGAEMSGVGGFPFALGAPPLLAVQGTADKSNEPRYTDAFFTAARRPKYLLRLLGAGHLPPYTYQQPQLSIVERVSVAFLDGYLKHRSAAPQSLAALGSVPVRAALLARP
jgi:predicted dienelactone hydrolase